MLNSFQAYNKHNTCNYTTHKKVAKIEGEEKGGGKNREVKDKEWEKMRVKQEKKREKETLYCVIFT